MPTTEKPLEELSEKALRQRLERGNKIFAELNAADPKEVVRAGKAEENIATMRSTIASLEAVEAELGRRGEQGKRERFRQTVENMPVGRAFRNREDRRKKREKTLAPLMSALSFVVTRAHPELRDSKLVADRLSSEEGAELVALVTKARAFAFDEESAEPLSPEQTARYEELLGIACGDPATFQRERRKAEASRKLADLKEERRVASLPRRPQLAEPGSVEVPRFVYSWLASKENVDGRWTVADAGVLVALLLAFENKDASIVAGARFEQADGELVLVIAGGIGSDLRFAGAIGGSPISDSDTSGFVRLRPALATLVRNGWLSAQVTAGETRIKLGARAKKARDIQTS